MQEKDYKDTLNLPKTDFAMRANLSKREPLMLEQWLSEDIYKKVLSARKGKEEFVFHDGPPYANGDIHLGHALNKVLKDITVKSKLLSGFYATFIPGWDCHGLPIELNVEKKKGKAGVKISVDDFRAECRKYADTQIDIQMAGFKRLGVFADWQNPYLTKNYKYEADTIRAVKKIAEAGHLVKGEKPVNWCLDCGSSLAEAEVEYKQKVSTAIDVKFNFVDVKKAFDVFAVSQDLIDNALDFSIVIWTTTAWTLPANQAVAVHKDLTYSLVEVELADSKEYLVLAKDLVDSCLERYDAISSKVLAEALGKDLELLELKHPLLDKNVPILIGDHVTVESGTGAVHTAPAHGADDFELAKKYSIEVFNPVKSNGCYIEDLALFGGQFILKAIPNILAELSNRKLTLAEKKYEHSYPHCWRHKTPIVYRATPQWFISMDKAGLRQRALEEISKVKWYPAWGENRIRSMIADRPDWCISRQRYWGVPLPLVLHKETGELHPEYTIIMGKVADLVEEKGVEAWYEVELSDLISDHSEYEKNSDTLDVWFDSGVSHYAVLDARSDVASSADLYLEGSDQHRGWFQSSLLTSVAMHDKAPYKEVLTHGYTVDSNGYKMSKSLGNVISPKEIIDKLGADVLRLWVSSAEYRNEISYSEEIFKRASDTYRRIRNTIRFLLANLHDFTPEDNLVETNDLVLLDKWIIAKAELLQDEIISAYNKYDFHVVYQKLHNFCVNELGGFYLDIIKDRQYTLSSDHVARRSCQTAMYHVVQAILKWIAPILSFTAEEAYKELPFDNKESVFIDNWYTLPKNLLNEKEIANWQLVLNLRDRVNRELEEARNNKRIGSSLDAELTLEVGEGLHEILYKIEDDLHFIFITSKVILVLNGYVTYDDINKELAEAVIKISAATAKKCVRCWHRNNSVGMDKEDPELCIRCISNTRGNGEIRKYA